MKRFIITITGFIIIFQMITVSQENSVYPQPTNLVTIPTAGIIPRGAYLSEFRLFSGGGVLAGISAGISQRFMFGVAYGGANIIGNEKINWHNQPGVEIKYRFIEESAKLPAFLIGFNSQGQGAYLDSLKRYETKAKGFYLVASKNYRLLGNLGIHAGINYNPLEGDDKDKDPSFFIGLDKNINPEISFVIEYDAAFNDNETNDIGLGEGKGYLNAGIRWTMVERFHLEIDFNNILLNRSKVDFLNRELKITFVEFF
ncbi:MAG: hypothetical protein KAT54_03220 [Candidatus Marinimicrobia bacterium]|nr:hypothetical protein [Candidatus Neomarinimicrobiota bacterium]